MKILALDTSSRYLCLGLADGPRTYEYVVDTGMALSRVLVPTIERVLGAAGLAAADIDQYAIGLGPGSFTALRIGHAVIKAMAWLNRRPVAGVPTLEIIAANPQIPDGIVVPVVDAKRSLVYCGWYQKTGSVARRVSADRLLPVDAFISAVRKKMSAAKGKGIIICGDGLLVCADKIKAGVPAARLLEKDLWYPQPQALMSAARRRIQQGRTGTAFEIAPAYLYPHDCQVRARQHRA